MTDKDILISDLNDISEILNNNGYGGWCETIRKAIALLKKQEAQKFFVDESGKITPLPIVFPNCPLKEYEAVVRCKDCKHYDETQRGTPRAEKRRYVCDDFNPPDDWFCADGERKEVK